MERGKPPARASAVASGTFSRAVRSRMIGQRAGHHEHRKPDRERHQHRPAAAIDRKDHGDGDQRDRGAPIRRWATPSRSPRFQASSGPNGTASSSGTNSGPKVALKNGAPTEIFSPVSASSASG